MECHAHAGSIGMMQEFLICVVLGTALTMEAVGSLEKSLEEDSLNFCVGHPAVMKIHRSEHCGHQSEQLIFLCPQILLQHVSAHV